MHLIIVGAMPICAIVIPLDDERLRDKFSSESSALIIQQHERVRLWRGYVPADDFWVYDGSELAFCKFRRQLIERVTQDDFELKFSLLCGPDHMQDMSEFPSGPWDCKEIFFSDISRDKSPTMTGSMSLKQLDLYGPWKRVVIDGEWAQKKSQNPPPPLSFLGFL